MHSNVSAGTWVGTCSMNFVFTWLQNKKRTQKITQKNWRLLAALGGLLAALRALFVALGPLLGALWGLFAALGALLAPLGPLLGALGPLLAHLGGDPREHLPARWLLLDFCPFGETSWFSNTSVWAWVHVLKRPPAKFRSFGVILEAKQLLLFWCTGPAYTDIVGRLCDVGAVWGAKRNPTGSPKRRCELIRELRILMETKELLGSPKTTPRELLGELLGNPKKSYDILREILGHPRNPRPPTNTVFIQHLL